LTDIREVLKRLRITLLRPYYLLLFYYHLRMYKKVVKNAEGDVNSKKIGGEWSEK